MIANGAITVGQPGTPGITPGAGNYTLYYVEVSDPWTGYARSQPGSAGGTVGWGENTWLRYGYDVLGNGQGLAWIAPNGGTIQNARPGIWFNCFNVSVPQQSYGFNGYGYKFTVEPQGPESLDTGDPAIDGSLPSPPPLLNTQITSAANALTYANSDAFSGNSSFSSTLASDLNANGGGGGFDPNAGDTTLLQLPGEQGDGDWLVPYDGGGGTNDVQGALLIDQDTGVVDEATWITPQDNLPFGISLSELDAMMNDEVSGNEPTDNPVPQPEPGTMCLLIGGGMLAAGRWVVRRRRVRR
jgi:hypothetical protein